MRDDRSRLPVPRQEPSFDFPVKAIIPAILHMRLLVLAGGTHTKARVPAWAAEAFAGTPVPYIAGNHEF